MDRLNEFKPDEIPRPPYAKYVEIYGETEGMAMYGRVQRQAQGKWPEPLQPEEPPEWVNVAGSILQLISYLLTR